MVSKDLTSTPFEECITPSAKLTPYKREELYFYHHLSSHFRNRHCGRKAIVIGNGESRKDVDLWKLNYQGYVLFACNAYYRDTIAGSVPSAKYLGAVDPMITREVMESEYGNSYWTFLVPERVFRYEKDLKKKPVWRPYFVEWDWTCNEPTGPEMVRLACYMGCKDVYLLSFDGPAAETNNIYKNTENYNPTPGGIKVTGPQIKLLCDEQYSEVNIRQIDHDWIGINTISLDSIYDPD